MLIKIGGERGKVYTLPIIVEKDEKGYFVYCPALQGCYTQGDTYEEALENIKDAVRLHIEDIIESGEEISEASNVSLTTLEIEV
ncbi:MAG: type II toxin-antitoxin system HicB family antitoxin [Methanophagales archaeon]|nr:type II toxin-antitoxin system HicB family antitoxin [Methanophagales archaeon]